MSHNIHLITVKADDFFSASEKAMEYIEDWGTENNWRKPVAVMSETMDFRRVGSDDRYSAPFLKEISSLSGIETMLMNYSEDYFKYTPDTREPEWYDNFEEKPFNAFVDECYPYEYDYVGVTNICEETNGERKYIVYIDMHS